MVEFLPEIHFRRHDDTSTRQNQELFRLFFESLTGYAIILLDSEGKILSWSPAAQCINGYQAEEIIGKDFAVLHSRQDIRKGRPQEILAKAAAEGRVEEEGWRLRKDGSRFWAHVVLTALRDKAGRLSGFGKIVSDVTQRKQAERSLQKLSEKQRARVQERTRELAQANRELRDSLEHLRALAARLQSVREDERASVARDIHDDLGQTLTAMKMDLVGLTQRLPPGEASLQVRANSVLKLVDETIFSVRRIASMLRPAMLDDLGLSAAIEWQAQEFQTRTGIACELVLPPGNVVLGDERSTAVFRIFQETLTNIARHAAATHVAVTLKRTQRELILEVVDNGKGFKNALPTERKSLGILGMEERALILGGGFEICGQPGQGTTVKVRIPLEAGRPGSGSKS